MKTNHLLGLSLIFLVSCGSNKSAEDNETSESSIAIEEQHDAHDDQHPPSTSKSPRTSSMAIVGSNHIHIDYSSPSARGRQIFGGLVAYNEVWVTGAHHATSITFSNDVEVDGVKIAKDKYALFTIPGEEEWTIIINKNWDQHLADNYDSADDIVRVQVKPVKLKESIESLTFDVVELDENRAAVSISWDDISVSFEVINL